MVKRGDKLYISLFCLPLSVAGPGETNKRIWLKIVIRLTVVDVYNKSKVLEWHDSVLNKAEIRKTSHQPKY